MYIKVGAGYPSDNSNQVSQGSLFVTQRSQKSVNWAVSDAIAARAISVLTLLPPLEPGGYDDWNVAHFVFHDVSAILVRIVVLAAAGATLGTAWHRMHRYND
jgi:hypothetical protein